RDAAGLQTLADVGRDADRGSTSFRARAGKRGIHLGIARGAGARGERAEEAGPYSRPPNADHEEKRHAPCAASAAHASSGAAEPRADARPNAGAGSESRSRADADAHAAAGTGAYADA